MIWGEAEVVMLELGSGYKYRWSFTGFPTAHLLLCSSVPSRPRTGYRSVAWDLRTPALIDSKKTECWWPCCDDCSHQVWGLTYMTSSFVVVWMMCTAETHTYQLFVATFQGCVGREEQWENTSSKLNLYIIRKYFNDLFSSILLIISHFNVFTSELVFFQVHLTLYLLSLGLSIVIIISHD